MKKLLVGIVGMLLVTGCATRGFVSFEAPYLDLRDKATLSGHVPLETAQRIVFTTANGETKVARITSIEPVVEVEALDPSIVAELIGAGAEVLKTVKGKLSLGAVRYEWQSDDKE